MKKGLLFGSLLSCLVLAGCASNDGPAKDESSKDSTATSEQTSQESSKDSSSVESSQDSSSVESSQDSSSTITVVEPTSVTIAGDAEVEVGKDITLTATVAPEDTTDKTITWTSSDPETATVDATGKVTGVKAGEVTITATSSKDTIKETKKITVKTPVVLPTKVALNVGSHTNILNGQTFQLEATLTPDTATNKGLIWESSAPDIISVDENGLLTTHKLGDATITVKAAGKETIKDTTTAHSTSVPTGISFELNRKPITELKLKVNGTAKPYVKYEGDHPYNGGEWSFEDPTMVSVTSWGEFTALKAGTTTATFTSAVDKNVKGTLKITIEELAKDPAGTFDFNDIAPNKNVTAQTLTNGTDKLVIEEVSGAFLDPSNAGGKTVIKLGDKNSGVGKIVFTLPAGYSKVEVYAAQWADGAGTLKINGAEQTLTKIKTDAEFDKFVIDIPADGKLTLEGGKRTVVDKLVFVK